MVYLSDEEHNLIVVQIRTDLKQLAVEDIIIPSVLISAINLQWRSEFRSALPILFASDLTAFSSNPKESHLQRMFNELRNTVEVKSFMSNESSRFCCACLSKGLIRAYKNTTFCRHQKLTKAKLMKDGYAWAGPDRCPS